MLQWHLVFDGMHRGHSKVFEALDIRAKEKNLKRQ